MTITFQYCHTVMASGKVWPIIHWTIRLHNIFNTLKGVARMYTMALTIMVR